MCSFEDNRHSINQTKLFFAFKNYIFTMNEKHIELLVTNLLFVSLFV